MPETYVRPVTEAHEPRPEWIATWRFRLVALVVLAVAAFAVVLAYNYLNGSTRQDPSFQESLRPLASLASTLS